MKSFPFSLLVLGPLVFFCLAFNFVGLSPIQIFLFVLGFTWNAVLLAPGLEERAMSPSYNRSFIRFIFKFNRFINSFVDEERFHLGPSVARSVSPLLFSAAITFLFGGKSQSWFVIMGSTLMEILHHYKNFKQQYEAAKKNYPEESDEDLP